MSKEDVNIQHGTGLPEGPYEFDKSPDAEMKAGLEIQPEMEIEKALNARFDGVDTYEIVRELLALEWEFAKQFKAKDEEILGLKERLERLHG